ncbi:hypothetical protein PoB_004983700 [Plakobranchus ocellatus]|uniref:Uncharacterized protein n=1 Tax=Plakobranchus ocellatus TaxID=259542 RepID=A0AAV4BW01_9GAST|nr:hypothetical protein PoB_004983700 [Plakobranchus ocellatus]
MSRLHPRDSLQLNVSGQSLTVTSHTILFLSELTHRIGGYERDAVDTESALRSLGILVSQIEPRRRCPDLTEGLKA